MSKVTDKEQIKKIMERITALADLTRRDIYDAAKALYEAGYQLPPEQTDNREAVAEIIRYADTKENPVLIPECLKEDYLNAADQILSLIQPPELKVLSELEPNVDAEFGQIVCCDILPKYGITDSNCYTEIIDLAYKLADKIAQAQVDYNKRQLKGEKLRHEQSEYMWKIYYEHSPEMAQIRELLGTHSG